MLKSCKVNGPLDAIVDPNLLKVDTQMAQFKRY